MDPIEAQRERETRERLNGTSNQRSDFDVGYEELMRYSGPAVFMLLGLYIGIKVTGKVLDRLDEFSHRMMARIRDSMTYEQQQEFIENSGVLNELVRAQDPGTRLRTNSCAQKLFVDGIVIAKDILTHRKKLEEGYDDADKLVADAKKGGGAIIEVKENGKDVIKIKKETSEETKALIEVLTNLSASKIDEKDFQDHILESYRIAKETLETTAPKLAKLIIARANNKLPVSRKRLENELKVLKERKEKLETTTAKDQNDANQIKAQLDNINEQISEIEKLQIMHHEVCEACKKLKELGDISNLQRPSNLQLPTNLINNLDTTDNLVAFCSQVERFKDNCVRQINFTKLTTLFNEDSFRKKYQSFFFMSSTLDEIQASKEDLPLFQNDPKGVDRDAAALCALLYGADPDIMYGLKGITSKIIDAKLGHKLNDKTTREFLCEKVLAPDFIIRHYVLNDSDAGKRKELFDKLKKLREARQALEEARERLKNEDSLEIQFSKYRAAIKAAEDDLLEEMKPKLEEALQSIYVCAEEFDNSENISEFCSREDTNKIVAAFLDILFREKSVSELNAASPACNSLCAALLGRRSEPSGATQEVIKNLPQFSNRKSNDALERNPENLYDIESYMANLRLSKNFSWDVDSLGGEKLCNAIKRAFKELNTNKKDAILEFQQVLFCLRYASSRNLKVSECKDTLTNDAGIETALLSFIKSFEDKSNIVDQLTEYYAQKIYKTTPPTHEQRSVARDVALHMLAVCPEPKIDSLHIQVEELTKKLEDKKYIAQLKYDSSERQSLLDDLASIEEKLGITNKDLQTTFCTKVDETINNIEDRVNALKKKTEFALRNSTTSEVLKPFEIPSDAAIADINIGFNEDGSLSLNNKELYNSLNLSEIFKDRERRIKFFNLMQQATAETSAVDRDRSKVDSLLKTGSVKNQQKILNELATSFPELVTSTGQPLITLEEMFLDYYSYAVSELENLLPDADSQNLIDLALIRTPCNIEKLEILYKQCSEKPSFDSELTEFLRVTLESAKLLAPHGSPMFSFFANTPVGHMKAKALLNEQLKIVYDALSRGTDFTDDASKGFSIKRALTTPFYSELCGAVKYFKNNKDLSDELKNNLIQAITLDLQHGSSARHTIQVVQVLNNLSSHFSKSISSRDVDKAIAETAAILNNATRETQQAGLR